MCGTRGSVTTIDELEEKHIENTTVLGIEKHIENTFFLFFSWSWKVLQCFRDVWLIAF